MSIVSRPLRLTTTCTVVAFDGSAASGVLTPGIYAVTADQACHIIVGSAPTATTNCFLLPATTLFFVNIVDASMKIAAIKNATAGNLYLDLVGG